MKIAYAIRNKKCKSLLSSSICYDRHMLWIHSFSAPSFCFEIPCSCSYLITWYNNWYFSSNLNIPTLGHTSFTSLLILKCSLLRQFSWTECLNNLTRNLFLHLSLQGDFPANTNILYVDLPSAELVGSSINESSLPGMVLNVKKPITYMDQFGMKHWYKLMTWASPLPVLVLWLYEWLAIDKTYLCEHYYLDNIISHFCFF